MLAVENITKRFSGVVALENVSLQLYAGEVNAVIGENGAGKSTLMKILSGVHKDYEGRIFFEGRQVQFSGPREAQHCGIAIIHQELNLIPCLSISENIFLGREILTPWGTLNKKEMWRRTRSLLDRLKLKADPDQLTSVLKVGEQQVVEIAKALLTDAKVIIMDEPTSAISESEVEVLFGIIDDLKKEGKTIVYISHKLDELFRIAGKFIILRNGKAIDAGAMKQTCREDIIEKMVGREFQVFRKGKEALLKKPLLVVDRLSLKHPLKAGVNILREVSLHVGKGEVVGIFGLMGAGRTELLETLFGLHPGRSSGNMAIESRNLSFRSPWDAIRAGLALVPEDRKKDGLVLGMDVRTNISLSVLQDLEHFGILSDRKESALADQYITALRIKTPSDSQMAENLSGGNQQKIVLAKWLATKPKVLMLDEPTRGIDIHAKNEIYKLILQLAGEGLGIIVVSSEMPEILAISDRILVMAEGKLTAEFRADEASESRILKAAIPQSTL